MDEAIVDRLRASGVACRIHEHEVARTVSDARERLPFRFDRYLKTVAFKLGAGRVALVALRGRDRVDYRRLAAAFGLRRADVRQLSPDEVRATLGIEAGSVGPVAAHPDVDVIVDEAALAMDTVYTGVGRADRTLEIRIADLLRITAARVLPIAQAADGAEAGGSGDDRST